MSTPKKPETIENRLRRLERRWEKTATQNEEAMVDLQSNINIQLSRVEYRLAEAEKATVPAAAFMFEINDRIRTLEMLLSQRRGLEVEQGQKIATAIGECAEMKRAWADLSSRLEAFEEKGISPKVHPSGCRCISCDSADKHPDGCQCSMCGDDD